jgi:anhydro-N-acetylmuramic acid kinase
MLNITKNTKNIYLGLMSGTSLDGIDIALCEIDGRGCKLLIYKESSLPKHLKNMILEIINHEITIAKVGELDCLIAEEYANAVNSFLKRHNINKEEIIAIGSHGQTLWHQPNAQIPFSMQLGNPSLLAVRTGIDVVADFRSKDVALGGQGAPFAPAFHKEMFSHIDRCAVVNIGGMANITVFSPTIIGYDSGCGNVLMDMWISECKSIGYDKDGDWASSGEPNHVLLENMLEDNYFKLNYPKSTGREYFNKSFLRKYLAPCDKISDRDIQATLLALTVISIANEIKRFDIGTLLVCGGGAKNLYLMKQLQEALPLVDVAVTDKYGVGADEMEAMIFAWFAYKRLRSEKIVLKTVTGATKNTILGGIYAAD